MAENTKPIVEREVQCYDRDRVRAEPHTVDGGFTIEGPHPLFDVPLEETTDRFIEELRRWYRMDALLARLHDMEDDVHCLFPFEQTIERVIDPNEEIHGACADVAHEHVYGQKPDYRRWEELALDWLWKYLDHYNLKIEQREPEEFVELMRRALEVQESTNFEPKTIAELVETELEFAQDTDKNIWRDY